MLAKGSLRIFKADLWDVNQTGRASGRKFQRYRKSHKFSGQTCDSRGKLE